MDEHSELDDLVLQIESEVDRFIGDQSASRNFVAAMLSTERSEVGDYPQASLDTSKEYLEDDGDLYQDRFPKSLHEPIVLELSRAAKWTDVLSAGLWSHAFLLSDKALAVFEQFDLGKSKKYKAEVRRGKEVQRYTLLFVANHVLMEDIDIGECEFYLEEMSGSPKHLVEVSSVEDLKQKKVQAMKGELEGSKRFNRLAYKKLTFMAGHAPKPAIFGMGKLSATETYVRRELYEALRDAGLTGLEFRRNNKLFD
ncbi:hypothetical protein [Stieleria varia]|uniref:Uncharacterized protein n=1 Tax=Stieleria varia TaxID=2528005 RepID=A0A5C6AWL4_9BACT|nr:hypothetical protein [Stieleria varia]TWU04415.1 hypothetical protein Pla52n_24550 [Stieleria varia]